MTNRSLDRCSLLAILLLIVYAMTSCNNKKVAQVYRGENERVQNGWMSATDTL
jgi:hypothetical protein